MTIFYVRVASAAADRLVDVVHGGVTGNLAEFVDVFLRRERLGGGMVAASVCRTEMFNQGAHALHHMYLGGGGGEHFVCLSSPVTSTSDAEQFFIALRQLLNNSKKVTVAASLQQPLISASSSPLTQQIHALVQANNERTLASSSPQSPKIQAIHAQLDEVRVQMDQNIELIIQRGISIDHLADSSDQLADHAIRFQHGARLLRRAACKRNAKTVAALTFIFAAVAYVCASAACGTPNLASC